MTGRHSPAIGRAASVALHVQGLMAKLKLLAPRISTLKPRISNGREGKTREQYRREENPWRAWYQSREWKALRLKVLIRDGWKCAACGCVSFKAGKIHVDHIEPHRGSWELFSDESNLQLLCDECHGKKQVLEFHR